MKIIDSQYSYSIGMQVNCNRWDSRQTWRSARAYLFNADITVITLQIRVLLDLCHLEKVLLKLKGFSSLYTVKT